ncbi:MAG: DUF3566 domain-containing protein [Sciscionella sp.]
MFVPSGRGDAAGLPGGHGAVGGSRRASLQARQVRVWSVCRATVLIAVAALVTWLIGVAVTYGLLDVSEVSCAVPIVSLHVVLVGVTVRERVRASPSPGM